MAAIGFLIGEMVSVLVPAQPRCTEIDAIDRRLGLLTAGHVEEVELIGRELVAGQGVGAFLQPGPAAARGRRLDQNTSFASPGSIRKATSVFESGAHDKRP